MNWTCKDIFETGTCKQPGNPNYNKPCGKNMGLPGCDDAVNPHRSGENASAPDMVNHPPHYTSGRFECLDVIFDVVTQYKDPVSGFLTGQVIKYIWRWPHKNGIEDLKKIRFYLDRLIEHEEKKNV